MSSISVVVPVYKVENYLCRCVDSILHQTFCDFDLVLVDDGSPDRCPEMCDEIAQSDPRVHVIHQKNGGLSAARNAGIEWALKNSNSEWITFIDSDDWVHPQYLKCFLNAVQAYHQSVCMCKFHFAEQYSDDFEPISEQDYSVMQTEEAFQTKDLDPNSSCGRLYRKELFRELRFPVGKLHEDRFTTYQVLFQFSQIAIVQKPMYYYYSNPDGIVHAVWSPRKLDDLEATEQQMTFFKSADMRAMYAYTVMDYISLLINNLKNVHGRKEYMPYEREIRRKLRKTLRTEKSTLELSIKKNFHIYKHAYPLFAKLYRRICLR